ncbi:pilus assembly protein PilC [Lujinxingia litoralis]|uniref:Pilus assembly protein PilC n=1 Tax=Lujinxingia litoralis TaxID=2211119 RepID=A0A328C5D4_9DELT|nr:type II secretion system F family protein [Lujinxingia litoralis]RAL22781.1 pilus assembly protein PilC [Lujinxingia litoralis]
MPVFVWEGTNRSGEARKGQMNASNAEEVEQRLRQQEINVSRVKKKATKSFSFKGGSRVPNDNLVIFTRQFATMIDAGLPLVQCLELLGSNEPHKGFQRIIGDIRKDIESGSTLSDAMAKHPGAFDNLYVSLVAAGEVAGILDAVMNRLAMQIEKSQKLRRRIKGAFTYPTIVIVIAIVIVIGMLYKIIPTFAAMFADMGGGAQLPAPTRFVMALSEFVQGNFLYIAGGMVAIGFTVSTLMNYKPTRAIIDDVALKVPVIGDLLQKSAVARFTRTLGTMVSSGVPIVDSLDIVAKTAGNMTIQKAIYYVRERISEGQNMVDPLMETGIFPKMVVQMIGVGEATGALDTMLNKIADFYEDEVDVAVESMTALIEPIMMVGLGGIVGGMLISMYLPIFEMAGNISA